MPMRDDLPLRPRRPRGPIVFSVHWDVTPGQILAGVVCGLAALLLARAVFS